MEWECSRAGEVEYEQLGITILKAGGVPQVQDCE